MTRVVYGWTLSGDFAPAPSPLHAFLTLQFEDGIYALGKAHMRSTRLSQELPLNVAFAWLIPLPTSSWVHYLRGALR